MRYRIMDLFVFSESKILEKNNHLLAVFHGKTFHNFYLYRNRGTVIWTAESWRGKILNLTCKKLGFNPIFISEKSPKRGFVDYLRKLKETGEGVVAVDGPLGPNQNVYPGILQLAAASGLPIYPVGAYYSHKIKLFWRWDRYEIPWPFSKVTYVIGEPLQILKEAIDTDDKLMAQCKILKSKMLECQEQAQTLTKAV